MARDRNLAVTPETARRIVELINSGPGPLHTRPSRGWGTGRHPMLVLCESSEAAGSSGVAGQVYPAVIIGGHATETTQTQFGRAWLTVLGTDADAVEPVAGQTYLAMRAGDYDPDPDGEESDPGPRVFSTVIGEGGGGGDSPCDCQWIAALKIEDCLRFSPDGETPVIAEGTEAAGGGSEAMADPTSVLSHGLILSESTTTEADGDSWTATVEICGVERTATFIRTRYGPVMRLTWSDEYDVFTEYGQYCCQNGKAVFAFAKRDLCEVSPEAECAGVLFKIVVECVECPPVPVATLTCCDQEETVNERLYVTFSGASFCPCLDGVTVPIDFDEGSGIWSSECITPGCEHGFAFSSLRVTLVINCHTDMEESWWTVSLTVQFFGQSATCDGTISNQHYLSGGSIGGEEWACGEIPSPFLLSGTMTGGSGGGALDCTGGLLGFIISETAP